MERLEAKFAAAGEADAADLDIYARVSANLRRLLESVGLQRRSRDVTTFGDLLRQDQERQRREREQQQIERVLGHD